MGYTVKELSKKNPYYISKERRMELEHYCKQYDEWKQAIKDLNFYGDREILEVRSTDPSDCTYERAMIAIKYSSKIHLIEDILATIVEEYKSTYPSTWCIDHQELYSEMLKVITNGYSYDKSDLSNYISEYRYRELRRQFFYILSERRD